MTLTTANNTDAKQTQINEYYLEQYRYLSETYTILNYGLLILIVTTLLNKFGLFPNSLFRIVTITVLVGMMIYAIYRSSSYLRRSNTTFTEFNWNFVAPKQSAGSTSSSNLNPNNTGVCYNGSCCGTGQVWNPAITKCVIN